MIVKKSGKYILREYTPTLIFVVEVLEDNSTNEKEAYKLKILKTIRGSLKPGDICSIRQFKSGQNASSTMGWELWDIDWFIKRYPQFKEQIEATTY